MLDRSESALRVVVRSKFYRSAFLALLIAGIGLSAATPQLTLFLVRDLGTPLPVAGLYYVTNLAARWRVSWSAGGRTGAMIACSGSGCAR